MKIINDKLYCLRCNKQCAQDHSYFHCPCGLSFKSIDSNRSLLNLKHKQDLKIDEETTIVWGEYRLKIDKYLVEYHPGGDKSNLTTITYFENDGMRIDILETEKKLIAKYGEDWDPTRATDKSCVVYYEAVSKKELKCAKLQWKITLEDIIKLMILR